MEFITVVLSVTPLRSAAWVSEENSAWAKQRVFLTEWAGMCVISFYPWKWLTFSFIFTSDCLSCAPAASQPFEWYFPPLVGDDQWNSTLLFYEGCCSGPVSLLISALLLKTCITWQEPWGTFSSDLAHHSNIVLWTSNEKSTTLFFRRSANLAQRYNKIPNFAFRNHLL